MLTRSGVGWRVRMKTSGRKIYLAWGARVAPRCELFHPFTLFRSMAHLLSLELTYLGPHFPMLRQFSFPSPTIAALHVSANREEIDACAKSCASNFDAQLMRASCMHT